MERMYFDIFKRQSKDKRINYMIYEHKKKVDELSRIKTFNRLIDDANRRFVQKHNQEKIDDEIEEMNQNIKSNKKYKKEEWEEIYLKR